MPRDIDLEMKAENPRVPEMDEETKQKLIEFVKVMGSGFVPGDPYGSYKVYEKEGKDTEALVKAVGHATESLLAQAALAGLGVAGKQLYSTMKSARAAKKAASAIPKNVKGLPKQTVDLNEEQIARLKKAEASKSEMAVEQRMQSLQDLQGSAENTDLEKVEKILEEGKRRSNLPRMKTESGYMREVTPEAKMRQSLAEYRLTQGERARKIKDIILKTQDAQKELNTIKQKIKEKISAGEKLSFDDPLREKLDKARQDYLDIKTLENKAIEELKLLGPGQRKVKSSFKREKKSESPMRQKRSESSEDEEI